ncbi:SCO family protein [Halovenus salina]|uniref:SCO family protein n=1 Tax=Halovenus salina TaxID=1510225 RepID=UPI002260C3DC|nr:SCO family protein [Halovenus salina]
MERRHYLRTAATVGLAGAAGCLNVVPGFGDDRTVLDEPEIDLSAAAHPSHGDDLPSVTVLDPLLGEEVSTDQFEGERAVLLTLFYTNCPDGMCPALILRLRRAQERAAEAGYGDDAAFLALTFDPERDTADVLETYAAQQGVDLGASNWHFLRPETFEGGADLIEEQFGLVIEKQPADEYESLEYVFPHYNLILLANADGVVERAYPDGATVDVSRVVEDFETVVTA